MSGLRFNATLKSDDVCMLLQRGPTACDGMEQGKAYLLTQTTGIGSSYVQYQTL